MAFLGIALTLVRGLRQTRGFRACATQFFCDAANQNQTVSKQDLTATNQDRATANGDCATTNRDRRTAANRTWSQIIQTTICRIPIATNQDRTATHPNRTATYRDRTAENCDFFTRS